LEQIERNGRNPALWPITKLRRTRAPLSIVILAGGKSERMGRDKAFLQFGGESFISVIANELLGISDDIIAVVGTKNPGEFVKEVDDKRVRFVNDALYMSNPLGGMLTGLEAAMDEYAAVVACDLPLVRKSLISTLFEAAEGHDGAVPIWNPGVRLSMEPLCAVYNVRSMIKAINGSLARGEAGCKRVVISLEDVNYVPVSELREFDPELSSFRNINTQTDYDELLQELEPPILIETAARKKEADVARLGFQSGSAENLYDESQR